MLFPHSQTRDPFPTVQVQTVTRCDTSFERCATTQNSTANRQLHRHTDTEQQKHYPQALTAGILIPQTMRANTATPIEQTTLMPDATVTDADLNSDRPDSTELGTYSDEQATADEYESDDLSENTP